MAHRQTVADHIFDEIALMATMDDQLLKWFFGMGFLLNIVYFIGCAVGYV